jgi:hypothetical protein
LTKKQAHPDFTHSACRAPSLKCLHLSACNFTDQCFAEAINCFPQLEELDVTLCLLYGSACEAVGRACPQLKRFRLNELWSISRKEDIGMEALGIASTMPRLQELELIGNNLTNDGLMSILDRCPRLESLDIRECFNIQMDDALKLKCSRIRDLRLPHDPIFFDDTRYWPYYINSGVFDSDIDSEVGTYDDPLDDMGESMSIMFNDDFYV